MNYDALIKRAKKAINDATKKEQPASVHKVTIDDSIENLAGLVVVMHPDFIESKNNPSNQPEK